MNRHTATIEKTLTVNRRQKKFYEDKFSKVGDSNSVMKIWERVRASVYGLWNQIGIRNTILNHHQKWIGELNDLRVLDLGCYQGNDLTFKFALESRSYIGIDLSEKAIYHLRETLHDKGIKKGSVKAVDFLDPDFKEKGFDVIYAYSVLHHFEKLEVALSRLHQKLIPGGTVITYDPMETSGIVWFVRRLYRPFQSNADWEHPFDKSSIKLIEKYFEIDAIQGVMGFSKWMIPFALTPFGANAWKRLGRILHNLDLRFANRQGWFFWQCMSVTMRLRRRERILGQRNL